MQTTWQKDIEIKKTYPPLKEDIDVEVVIIGGGITGLTLAYLLSKEKIKVAILQKKTLEDSSHTAFTTAMIMCEVDTNFSDLVKILGKKGAIDVWQGGQDAISQIEEIIKSENIECEFSRVPAYIYANDEKEWQTVAEDIR